MLLYANSMKFNKVPYLIDMRVRAAYFFAMGGHAAIGQKRKYSDEDYIVHPAECVAILEALACEVDDAVTVAMQIAMVCHDLIEDTRYFVDEDGNRVKDTAKYVKSGRKLTLVEGVTLAQVEQMVLQAEPNPEVGPRLAKEVLRILSGLTDVSMPWDGNRTARKAIDLAHTAEQEGDVKTCKLADLISNAPSIIEHDPGFAVKWMTEKQALLAVLKDGGDPTLYAMAESIMNDYLRRTHNRRA